MKRREAPPTEEGWYALHDMRQIDWRAWAEAPQRARDRAIEDGQAFLESAIAVEDAESGGSVAYSMVGHKADLMLVHLRPTMADIDALERRFEQTALAEFTDQSTSYVSVTEASGYSEKGRQFIEGELDDDSGLANYMRSRLYPKIPDAEHVCFYPMDKRRDPEYNWYDLPFDERADHMDVHGEIGREYAGKVTQMITGSIGLDDWEWGVTLWANDLTQVKQLLYEMRFDPSSSKYAEFGPFYVGNRFAPADLPVFLAGEHLGESESTTVGQDRPATPADASSHGDGSHAHDGDHAHAGAESGRAHGGGDGDEHAHGGDSGHGHGDEAHAHGDDSGHGHGDEAHAHGGDDHGHGDDSSHADEADDSGASGGGGRPPTADSWSDAIAAVEDLKQQLTPAGLTEGEDYEPGSYGLAFSTDRDAAELVEETEGLVSNFDHYDTHVKTAVRANHGKTVLVSIWKTEDAAMTASGFLTDLDGIDSGSRGWLGEAEDDDADSSDAHHGDDSDGAHHGDDSDGAHHDDGGRPAGTDEDDDIRAELADRDIYAGQPHGEDVYALVLYSEAPVEELFDEVSGLRDSFDHYDTHVKTAVYDAEGDGPAAVVSLWTTQSAAETASDFLTDLPGIVRRAGEGEGFGTMGMFYTVKPDYREEFVDTFGDVGETLATMDGHRETSLLANHEDAADMFISSRWDSKEDAMGFFRSEDFRTTVQWGREVLADTPRHVFLA